MNQFLFVTHALVMSSCVLIALRFGKQALISFATLQIVLANLFVTKTITVFGLTATGADAYIIGLALSMHLIQEYYGRNEARKTIYLGFGLLLFYTLMTQFQLWYIPSLFDTNHKHFVALLEAMPRITGASLISYFIISQIDYRLYARVKQLTGGRYLVARNISVSAITQLLDTLLFSFLGLYGLVPNIGQIIIVSYTIKMFTLFLMAPSVAISGYFAKKSP